MYRKMPDDWEASMLRGFKRATASSSSIGIYFLQTRKDAVSSMLTGEKEGGR